MLHLCPHHTYSSILKWYHSQMQKQDSSKKGGVSKEFIIQSCIVYRIYVPLALETYGSCGGCVLIPPMQGANCPYCPSHCLDPLGHHALTCKYRGDVVSRHNWLRDVFLESCRRACIGAQVEEGSGLGHDQCRT